MVRVILSAIGIIIAFFTAVLAYFGAFSTIHVTESEIGPFTLVYQSNTGHYKQTGPTVDTAMDLAHKLGAVPYAGFGLYYDDPNVVPTEKLRSDAGIIIESKDIGKFQNYAANPQSEIKIKTREFSKTKAVTADFPLRGVLSIFIGIFKVYPAIDDYMKAKGLPMGHAFEIYLNHEKTVRYAFPLPN